MNKKLYKSNTDKKICGVCGVLAYIIAALIIPEFPYK